MWNSTNHLSFYKCVRNQMSTKYSKIFHSSNKCSLKLLITYIHTLRIPTTRKDSNAFASIGSCRNDTFCRSQFLIVRHLFDKLSMVVDLVVVHENQDSRVTSVRPCFGYATADDISFFSSRQPSPLSSAQCCQQAFSEESHLWFVWWYIQPLFTNFQFFVDLCSCCSWKWRFKGDLCMPLFWLCNSWWQ